MHIDRLKGLVNAPEFPKGLNWFNTDYPLLLNDFKGKIVLLDFWTYCCINCHHVLPDLKKLEEEFPNELVVIGVHSAKFTGEKDDENIREAVLRHKIEHPVVNDRDMTIWRHYAIRSWPSFVLVNPAGRIVGQSSGEGIYPKVQPIIKELIALFGADDMLNLMPVSFPLEAAKKPKTVLSFPAKLEIDQILKKLYIVDSNNNRIIVTNYSGVIEKVIGSGRCGLKDGSFSDAQFNQPQGVKFYKNKLYVADTENHAIRVVDFETEQVSTLIGNGEQAKKFNVEGDFDEISLNSPWDIEAIEDHLFVAMAGPHQLWEMNLAKEKASVWAGTGGETLRDGPRKEALLAQPSGLCFLKEDLIFADSETSAIRSVGITDDASVHTFVGQGLFDYGDIDGSGNEVRLQHPLAVTTWQDQLLIADTYNNKIKLLNSATKEVRTLIGTGEPGMQDGAFNEATFNEPAGLAITENILFIADTNNHLIRIADLANQEVRTLQLTNTAILSTSSGNKPPIISEDSLTTKTINIEPKANKLTLVFVLPETMILNESASAVAIFSDGSKSIQIPINVLRCSVDLSPFATKKSITDSTFLLHGSLYYCNKKTINTGQCFVHDFSQKISFSENEQANLSNELIIEIPDYEQAALF